MTALRPIDAVLDRLDTVTARGSGWRSRCPAHPDTTPSLDIDLGDDERVLLLCRAGCPTEAVVRALGLTLADLFPPGDRGGGGALPPATPPQPCNTPRRSRWG